VEHSGQVSSDEQRRLASVETITSVNPIDGADAIEQAKVRGWTVVVRKGEFSAGDQVLYIEVDAALPLEDPRFAFLSARGSREFGGRQVHVLKTAKLRGVYSQGIVFPIDEFPEVISRGASEVVPVPDGGTGGSTGHPSIDSVLGIVLYEPPLPVGQLDAVGSFPSWLTKTDAERVQNIDPETWDQIQQDRSAWVPTEKIDGSSLTAWRDSAGVVHVASRNLELSMEADNMWTRAANSELSPLAPGQWVQGEVAGPGIQKNPLALTKVRVFVFGFGTFDAEAPARSTTSRTPRDAWPLWAAEKAVPVYQGMQLPPSIDETIAQTESVKSIQTPGRGAEGVVWTHRDGVGISGLDGRAVFKSLSAKYLLKHS
jgi:RNA ligase (TIGR02306 family)